MESYSLVLVIVALLLEATIIVRAREGGFLAQFPLFYSYLAYVFCGSVATLLIRWVWPEHYSSAFWFYFLVTLLAEFAVLVEVSDHIFSHYPAIRRLGRLLIAFICALLLLLYILPSLIEPRSPSATILDFMKRASFTKAAVIITLLAATRYYALPLGKNISGMMLGFSAYIGTNVANFALAEEYGPALYGRAFSIIGPLSYTLGMVIWTVALWRYEPVQPMERRLAEGTEELSEPLSYQLGRFNTALTRLLRR